MKQIDKKERRLRRSLLFITFYILDQILRTAVHDFTELAQRFGGYGFVVSNALKSLRVDALI